ncbi:hypothetical protein DUI87_08549 [Hirundo rustica rustica]|uniref:Uncharacterized protein n=1 Tax=Hirundo rustica rustica TaxID=333673 RepID=A0A3M0KK86_HIRRU|nr:hypothetical protein DUI87_08549 [Hirundo rustica rustica]
MKWDDTEETVLDMAKKLRTYADAVHGPTHARIAALETQMGELADKMEENHKNLREEIKEDILQISAVQGWKHPTICHGLIQAALDKGEALEHLRYINDIIVWGNTALEVFEKGEEIIQILLEAGFAIKQSKVKGPA